MCLVQTVFVWLLNLLFIRLRQSFPRKATLYPRLQYSVQYYASVGDRLELFKKSVLLFQKISLRPGFAMATMSVIMQESAEAGASHWNAERVDFYNTGFSLNPALCCVNLIDPYFRGSSLTAEQKRTANSRVGGDSGVQRNKSKN